MVQKKSPQFSQRGSIFILLAICPSEITFFQGSLFTYDERETLNLGLGKRILSDDESFMYGLNAFYDHELDYDHQRGSIGAESIMIPLIPERGASTLQRFGLRGTPSHIL